MPFEPLKGLLAASTLAILGILVLASGYYLPGDDAGMAWLRWDESGAYKVIIPEGMEARVLGSPVARSLERWGLEDMEEKSTIAPTDGIPEVTSLGYDTEVGTVLVFYDRDAVERYGNRPYYAIIKFGGEGVKLREIEEEYTREIGGTGIYMARIPTGVNVTHHLIHKVYIQAPPPGRTYEINRKNSVQVKYAPDCDC